MDLSEQIKSIRNQKGVTQMDMAERLNVTQSNYGYLEKRGSKLTISQLKAIAEALGVHYLNVLGIDIERINGLERELIETKEKLKKAEDMQEIFMDMFKKLGQHKDGLENIRENSSANEFGGAILEIFKPQFEGVANKLTDDTDS